MTAVPLTDQLASIRAREAAATRGPWSTARDAGYAEEYGETFVANWSGEYMLGVGDFSLGAGEEAEADLAFVLGARTDVPALLAEVDRLRAQAEAFQVGAIEREALLAEARDVLEAAGQAGAHGDDWPAVAPTISALAAERHRLQGELGGARSTIEHMSNAMSWISSHDRQGLDHLDEAQREARGRESAVKEARRWAARAKQAETELEQARQQTEAAHCRLHHIKAYVERITATDLAVGIGLDLMPWLDGPLHPDNLAAYRNTQGVEANPPAGDLCEQCQHTEADHDDRNGYCTQCEAERAEDICRDFLAADDVRAAVGVVHACPPGNSALTPCCGKTPFELARTDRLTYDQAEITCAPTQPTT